MTVRSSLGGGYSSRMGDRWRIGGCGLLVDTKAWMNIWSILGLSGLYRIIMFGTWVIDGDGLGVWKGRLRVHSLFYRKMRLLICGYDTCGRVEGCCWVVVKDDLREVWIEMASVGDLIGVDWDNIYIYIYAHTHTHIISYTFVNFNKLQGLSKLGWEEAWSWGLGYEAAN